MKILLTNDDGFDAPGLQALYKELARSSRHELYIVAPESQRSATGHSITLFNPLFLTRHSLEGSSLSCAVQGTPADCVKLALQGGIYPRPDLIVSGINKGPNLGTDVFYSGTVSAAMEGVLLGVPGLAVSLASFEFNDYQPAATFTAEFIERYGQKITGLLNINIPGIPSEAWKGHRVTKLGKAVYENIFEFRKDPRGREYYWQGGEMIADHQEDSDITAVKLNYISITPMHSDLTDYEQVENWTNVIQAEKQE